MKRFSNRKTIALLVGLGWSPLLVTGCQNGAASGALAKNVVKVQKDMNETQVRGFLGEPTSIISDSLAPSPNASISINAWIYDGPPKINVGFMNGSVNAVTVDGKQTVGP